MTIPNAPHPGLDGFDLGQCRVKRATIALSWRYLRRMNILPTIVGCMRTALVAALVLALLGMSIASAHAMPCPDALHSTGQASSSNISDDDDHDIAHATTNDLGKLSDTHVNRCCPSMCSVCSALVSSTSDHSPIPIPTMRAPERGDHIAGIDAGPPHGPPRS